MSSALQPTANLWRHRPFLHYFGSRSLSEFSYQIAAVAVGWQIYALTHSALDLGLAGLAQFLPSALLMLPAGHVADRYARNRVVLIRVSAVNHLFINASNQLGAFESGATAALLGGVPAVVLGGVGTIAVALLWMKLFPTLRRVERLDGALVP